MISVWRLHLLELGEREKVNTQEHGAIVCKMASTIHLASKVQFLIEISSILYQIDIALNDVYLH